ncbi:hypothetical protein ACJIZ3_011174 [Penstemon smallii]|uniref:F-box domain-containing protein n=1 Tax=Penstemon smallii TaxID=265156 RepID=A0ABD3UM05_9LAMI
MEKFKKRKALQQRNSAEIIASNDDLLIEILLRLPIKLLIRFKSVSKHWQSLITNPLFRQLRNRTIGLMFPVDDRVLHSCNEVLLCVSYCARVCNPITNQLSVVQQPEIGNYRVIRGMRLAFDPATSPHYKVVCVQKLGIKFYQILLYSSYYTWGISSDPFTSFINSFKKGVYWNGAMHWMCYKRHLYFKIEDQVLDEMPKLPFSNDWNSRSNSYFGESCDHLHFVETRDTQIQLNVYEMKRNYSEWFIKYQIDLSPVFAAYPEIIRGYTNPKISLCYYDFSLFCIVSGWKEEESFLGLQTPTKVIPLNLVCKTFKTLYEFEGDFGHHWDQRGLKFAYTTGFQYIEALCCI